MTTQQEIQDVETPAEAAAMWWASVLRDPKLDNGDGNPLTAVLTAMTKDGRPEPATDVLDQFKANLIERLNESLNAADDYTTRYGIDLSVDYHPDSVLLDCADKAGFRGGMTDWPWKTTMFVKPEEVSVSYGYRASYEVIWVKKS